MKTKPFLIGLALVLTASTALIADEPDFKKQIAQWAPPGSGPVADGHFSNYFAAHYFSNQPFDKVWAHYAKLLQIDRPYTDSNSSWGMSTGSQDTFATRILHLTSAPNRKEHVCTFIRRAANETTTVTIAQDSGRVIIAVTIQPHRN